MHVSPLLTHAVFPCAEQGSRAQERRIHISPNPLMKYLPTIAGVLLGLLFLMASVTFFLGMMPKETIPEGTPKAMFLGAFGPTGYFAFVKACELIGGLLVLVPKTRNFGLLVLGPIIVNILAFGAFIDKAAFNPMTFIVVFLALYLLWDGRKKFVGLLNP